MDNPILIKLRASGLPSRLILLNRNIIWDIYMYI